MTDNNINEENYNYALEQTNEVEEQEEEYEDDDEVEYEMNATGQLIPKIKYTDDPYEEELLKKPIGQWGRAWMKWMETEYEYMITVLIMSCRWQIIPREIDIEAEKRWDELNKIYREKHPRPTTFNEMRIWEKERLLRLEHQVMEEIVYKVRE